MTHAELKILELVNVGHSNKQIAKRLFLSEDGVKFHMKNIHAKLGAANRTHAAQIARDSGLISLQPEGGLREHRETAPTWKSAPTSGHRCVWCGR